MAFPKRMNFRKSSKGGGGVVIFDQKIYVADFGPLNRAFTQAFRKILQHDFPKIRGELFRKYICFGDTTRPLIANVIVFYYFLGPFPDLSPMLRETWHKK